MQKNKKIALFSCHNDYNYGSMLQAYALAQAIKFLGGTAEYINYSTKPNPYSILTIIRRIVKIICGIFIKQKSAADDFSFFTTRPFSKIVSLFESFHEKHIPVSKELYHYYSVNRTLDVNKYDAFIVGGDQLWSPYHYSYKKPYFLDFAEIPKKSSYGTSIGTINISDEYLQLLCNKLSSFSNISCREKINAEKLAYYLHREVQYVVDPTLLLGQDDWNSVSKKCQIPGKFILAYILGEKDIVVNYARELAKTMNLPVYFILTRPKYEEFDNILDEVGPSEFIGLIKDANYIVTDSFHGTLFSIIFNKNFYSFSKRIGDTNHNDNIRILEFLTQLGLQDRYFDSEFKQIPEDIDYEKVNIKLNVLRCSSINFLKKCIE